ncbi:acetyl-CoA carboxylase biotin carboxylase subunit [Candidatus Nitrospira neomarina]|uniref:Biotin carboxylase n=1 Tax=Candidatus Nitrospira neomarina TaxID=3020899 RepID=A0AA96GJR8_9BACT|nr:acetyl-CoA carboxylase biotin carboxylase subunit [Candidatus Nitrospira neomarina]WNM63729.1 acetyl-CoA carboxylase biotin carboxylase subunit [Candidatus Nitrospira neomarina]
MFKKILIANRGEIALRVNRACRELGIRTVAIHSDVDAQSLHVRYADEHVCVGPAEGGLSYRNIPNVLSAAEITGVDAIHPGYGFLAENAHFAEVCESIGITFIGPTSEHIALLSDKSKARAHMKKRGIPVLPGSDGEIDDSKMCVAIAKKLGFPVIVKASAGGGGRGMRVVWHEEELTQAIESAQLEAQTAFGHGGVYLERFFEDPRHIEFQIMADNHGHVVHFHERDCSIQRRYQKVLEESPSPALDDTLRRKMGQVAVEAIKSVKYRNAGTVEFLMDQSGKFYFMEVNTRIQVEHPVTEMVTGVDLIKEQIRIAAGEELSYRQKDIQLTGHAIECRINAECPDRFTPSPGPITKFCPPGGPGIRVDTAMDTTGIVHPYYDSMIAKLIAFGRDRNEAIARTRRALDEFVIDGIKTSIPLHRRILDHPDFQKGPVSTRFLDRLVALQSP